MVSVFWAEDVRATLEELAERLEIVGDTLSDLITVIEVPSVLVFPAASVAVAVKLSVVEPKL